MTDHPEAEVLYYVGCAGSFDDRGIQISRAIVNVLKKADVDFAILGAEERCNGDMARRAGNEYLAQMMIQEQVDVFNQYKPKKILTGCPHCFNVFKNEYGQFGAGYNVVHHSEFFLELTKQNKLKSKGAKLEKLTFHDSCYLGRWNGLIEAPRELLRLLGLSRNPVEMKRTKTKGLCCGAGGGRMFMEENLGKRINIERAQEVMDSGATEVTAFCPYCITMLRDGIADLNGNVAVRDIAEIIDENTS
jgi:Fe-S oxidoreductase